MDFKRIAACSCGNETNIQYCTDHLEQSLTCRECGRKVTVYHQDNAHEMLHKLWEQNTTYEDSLDDEDLKLALLLR